MTASTTGTLPLVILLTPGMGGPHAWALRLRARAAPRRQVLIAVHGQDAALRPDFAFAQFDELRDWLLTRTPSIVLPNWLWPAYETCSRAKRLGADLGVVAFCRSDDWETYYAPLQDVAPHYDWLVAVSSGIRNRLVRMPHVRPDRLRTLCTFVDRPHVLDRAWQTAPLRILYSGRLEELHKGVFHLPALVRALAARGVDYQLTIAGDGSSRNELEQRLAAAAEPGRVVLAGALPPQDMPSVYLRQDVLVMTSSVEGRSNALLEGMAHGCVPVLFRTPTGWDEVLPDALRELAVAPSDVEMLAHEVARLSREPDRLEALGRTAHAATVDAAWESYEQRLDHFATEVAAGMAVLAATASPPRPARDAG